MEKRLGRVASRKDRGIKQARIERERKRYGAEEGRMEERNDRKKLSVNKIYGEKK